MDHSLSAADMIEQFPETALNGSIGDRFEEVARRFPDRLAASDAEQSLNYSALADLAGRFRTAISAVVVAERSGPIGIFCRNDVRYAAATLGVLTAGRGYVPMDIDFPIERNRLIAAHAGLAAVATSANYLDRAQGLFPPDVPIIDLESGGNADGFAPVRRPRAKDLADILYTSGSTGVPKGVSQSHKGRLYSILQRTRMLHLTCDDRLALCHSPSTIDGTRVTLTALLNGASLHILPPAHWKLSGLAQQMRARNITVLHSVPTLFRHITRELHDKERFSTLRIVHLSGERSDWSDLHRVKRYCGPQTVLAVALGSTESSASYTQWLVDAEVQAVSSQLPIGTEVADFEISIVDSEGRSVEDGAIGEIVVSSPYLALGYWRNLDLTDRVFGRSNATSSYRTIKTGDLGRRRPDGLFEFLGRKDHQIKLRGHRIELGDIEATIRECEGVRDAAAVVRMTKAGDARSIIAYVEIEERDLAGQTPLSLMSFLAQRLPGYMLPASIVVANALPRLANLKIDYCRLSELDYSGESDDRDSTVDDFTLTVAKIFEMVLGATNASSEDNILSLGGDSLQAIKVALELERQFGIAIQPENFFEMQTIRQVAEWINAHSRPNRPPSCPLSEP
jgi:amino acid adenylation domain-containing protein